MSIRNRDVCSMLLILFALFCVSAVSAQVNTINAARLFPREYNDDPNSVLVSLNTFPTLVSFDDQAVDGDGMGGEFANRHVWRFSANGGTSNYLFQNNDFFAIFMNVTLTGNPLTPRKEAGFLFDTAGGQAQFIVTTNQPNGTTPGEIAAFGGPLPFFKFTETYTAGETIRLGMIYFRDTDNKRKIYYYADSASSPKKEFTNLEQGIITGSRLGGYLQVAIAANNPLNFGRADYGNITVKLVRTVSGTVDLEDCVNMAGAVVRFTFDPVGDGIPITQTATLDSAGAFSLPSVPAGNYTVRVKGDRWLAKNVTVNTTSGDVSGVNVGTLRGGDADDSNTVDVDDLDLFIQAFDAEQDTDPGTPGDQSSPNWNPRADFNCSGIVDVDDLDIFIRNFDASGDEL
jgi:hypothetical protein